MPVPAVLLSEGAYLQFARLQSMSEWWHWLVLAAVSGGVFAVIAILYYYDSVELPRGVSWLLVTLRVFAFLGVLFFFLKLEKRTEQQVVSNSRVLLLIDTSQSMGLRDADRQSATAASRIEEVASELADGQLIPELRANHDVIAYTFDQGSSPIEIASFPKLRPPDVSGDSVREAAQQLRASLRRARFTAAVSAVFLLVSLSAAVVFAFRRRSDVEGGQQTSWSLLVSVVALIAAIVILAVANLRSPEVGLLATLGLESPAVTPPAADVDGGTDASGAEQTPPQVDWRQALNPRGVETRLGDALQRLVEQERGGPVAGIVLLSDGRSNAGVEYTAAAAAAQEAGLRVYTIGLGSDRRPVNVRVVDLEAPSRVYPGDDFTLTAYLQAYELSGRTVKVELFSAPAEAADANRPGDFVEELRVKLGADGELLPVRFNVAPGEPGRRAYRVRVSPLQEDRDHSDDEKAAEVRVVERKNHVLLLAGGPTREYRFLRNLLYRDRDTMVDVLLQSSPPGIAQEADEVLNEFPDSTDRLFRYDAIVAFDPDWQRLDERRIELLDRWVAEQAGGLVVVAGPVHTPQWANQRDRDRRIETVKGLYPVVFYSRGSALLNLGRFGGETAWPLHFSRDGLEAEFLWLEEDAVSSEQVWASFGGVYGYYAVKGAKPGARVYARFSNPDTAIDDELPIYFAGHFYGAGRVFFEASGEMWRLRAMDETYFDRFYTKLIRWVSQGRLLRDSSRGLLLVEKDRCLLGDQIAVRAILTDARHDPLMDEEVTAALIHPDGARATLVLRRVADSPREGMYAGQFTALQEGDYRLEMALPGGSEEELLQCEVRTRLPDLEIERPERNDPLLKDIAERTGGQYYVGVEAAMNRPGGGTPLFHALEPQDQVALLPGTPDQDFERRLMTWLMGLICGALCLEWLTRRLSKLA